jgi:hypothetical protein
MEAKIKEEDLADESSYLIQEDQKSLDSTVLKYQEIFKYAGYNEKRYLDTLKFTFRYLSLLYILFRATITSTNYNKLKEKTIYTKLSSEGLPDGPVTIAHMFSGGITVTRKINSELKTVSWRLGTKDDSLGSPGTILTVSGIQACLFKIFAYTLDSDPTYGGSSGLPAWIGLPGAASLPWRVSQAEAQAKQQFAQSIIYQKNTKKKNRKNMTDENFKQTFVNIHNQQRASAFSTNWKDEEYKRTLIYIQSKPDLFADVSSDANLFSESALVPFESLDWFKNATLKGTTGVVDKTALLAKLNALLS